MKQNNEKVLQNLFRTTQNSKLHKKSKEATNIGENKLVNRYDPPNDIISYKINDHKHQIGSQNPPVYGHYAAYETYSFPQ